MKAITIHQPWASLIAEGVKTIETRPKQHPWRSAIGQTIAIHVAARDPKEHDRVGPYLCTEAVRHSWFLRNTDTDPAGWPDCPLDHYIRTPLAAVVATCTLVDVVPIVAGHVREKSHVSVSGNRLYLDTYASGRGISTREVGNQLPFGDFAPGRWALLLDNIVKLTEPIPARGFQGLWNWSYPENPLPAKSENGSV